MYIYNLYIYIYTHFFSHTHIYIYIYIHICAKSMVYDLHITNVCTSSIWHETNSASTPKKLMGLEGEFPFGISIIFKGKRAVSFQGWCISMYFWKMSFFLHNSFQTFRTFIIHRGLRSWRMGGSSVVKFFFQATKDTSLHFQPPPPPEKWETFSLRLLCVYIRVVLYPLQGLLWQAMNSGSFLLTNQYFALFFYV